MEKPCHLTFPLQLHGRVRATSFAKYILYSLLDVFYVVCVVHFLKLNFSEQTLVNFNSVTQLVQKLTQNTTSTTNTTQTTIPALTISILIPQPRLHTSSILSSSVTISLALTISPSFIFPWAKQESQKSRHWQSPLHLHPKMSS